MRRWFLRVLLVLFSCLLLNPPSVFALSNPNLKTGNISPNSGSFTPDQTITFTTTFYDARGYRDIEFARFMVNTNFLFVRNCFYGQYNPITNKFYILDNAGRALLGGFIPGSNNIIENSYCRLDCSKSSVTASGNTLIVNWAANFKLAFAGTKNLYLYVKGNKGGFDGWDKKGAINILADIIAPTGTITINNDSAFSNSTSVTLNLTAADNVGGSGVSSMQFSNDGANWPDPEAYAATKDWFLTTGDGQKSVHVKFKDAVGNWSQVYSDTITLDTTPPQINIISPQDNEVIRLQ